MLSRVKVTAVSRRAQRGFASLPVVRVILRRVPAHRIEQDDVAAGRRRARAGAPCPSAPLTGGALRRSSSVSLPRLAAVARDDPRRRLVVAGTAPLEVQARRIAGPAQPGRRIADQLRPAHDAVDGQLEAGRLRRLRAGRWRRPDELCRRSARSAARPEATRAGKCMEKYTIALNRRLPCRTSTVQRPSRSLQNRLLNPSQP